MPGADEDADPRRDARRTPVGAHEQVVDDVDVVAAKREVELRAAALVHAEHVVAAKHAVRFEQLDHGGVTALYRSRGTGECAGEPVAAHDEVGPGPTVEKV